MADLQLTEKVDKLPQCFQLRQVSTGKYHTFMVSPLKDPQDNNNIIIAFYLGCQPSK